MLLHAIVFGRNANQQILCVKLARPSSQDEFAELNSIESCGKGTRQQWQPVATTTMVHIIIIYIIIRHVLCAARMIPQPSQVAVVV